MGVRRVRKVGGGGGGLLRGPSGDGGSVSSGGSKGRKLLSSSRVKAKGDGGLVASAGGDASSPGRLPAQTSLSERLRREEELRVSRQARQGITDADHTVMSGGSSSAGDSSRNRGRRRGGGGGGSSAGSVESGWSWPSQPPARKKAPGKAAAGARTAAGRRRTEGARLAFAPGRAGDLVRLYCGSGGGRLSSRRDDEERRLRWWLWAGLAALAAVAVLYYQIVSSRTHAEDAEYALSSDLLRVRSDSGAVMPGHNAPADPYTIVHVATFPAHLSHLTNLTYPYDPAAETPYFWDVHFTGESVVESIMSDCRGLVTACELGLRQPNFDEGRLGVFELRGARYVNVDVASAEGIERAGRLGLAGSGLADVVTSPMFHEVARGVFSEGRRGRMFAMFRDPIDRALGMYYYLAKATWDPMYNPSLSRMSIQEYAKSRYIENNFMTRYLIDKPGGKLTHADMLLAKKIIKFKCIVGLYDDIAESSDRFARYFGWRVDGPSARCARRVVAAGDRAVLGHPTSTRGENDRMSADTAVRAGSAAWNALAAQNRFDVELYEFARRIYRAQGEQIFDVAAARAGGGDVVGTGMEGVAAAAPAAMAPVAAEPEMVVETPASTDGRVDSSGRRDGNSGGASQEALDREISDGMHGIEMGATIRTDGGADGGGVRGAEQSLEGAVGSTSATSRSQQPSKQQQQQQQTLVSGLSKSEALSSQSGSPESSSEQLQMQESLLQAKVDQPVVLEPGSSALKQKQQQQQPATEDGDDDGGDFVISDSDLEAQGLEGSFADGAEKTDKASDEDQQSKADAGTDWMDETVDPATLAPREKCQIIYHLAVEGAGHHGFMPVMDKFLERQVDSGGYRGEKTNNGDFVWKAIFRGFRGRDIGVDDPELVKNVVRRICPDDGKKHVLQLSDSFPSRALGAGGNQHYRNDRVNAWQTMTSAEIAASGEARNHPVNLRLFYKAYSQYAEVKFIVLHRTFVQTLASHPGFDGGPDRHLNVLTGFMMLLSHFLEEAKPKYTLVCMNQLTNAHALEDEGAARRGTLSNIAELLGWPVSECDRCFDDWRDSSKQARKYLKAAGRQMGVPRIMDLVKERVKELYGVWPPPPGVGEAAEQQQCGLMY